MSACEIISLYSEVNKRCVDSGKALKKPKCREFAELTRIMCEVKEILRSITIKIRPPNYRIGGDDILTSFWNLYS